MSYFGNVCQDLRFKPANTHIAPSADIDRWILSELQSLVEKVNASMEAYELQQAVQPLIGFIDQLTDWYIRRSRSRFWEDEATDRSPGGV